MARQDLELMGATEAAAAIRRGDLTSRELTEACLARIEAAEPAVKAWAYLDPAHARAQAEAADEVQRQGAPLGPLHGVPVGIKDVFDTHDMPTENGSVLHSGRQPRRDAAVVARLRQAGAIVMGKTVTTEFAVYAPGKTTNPHDSTRTPGGSSSGSAAAVASFMVPLAVGTQTNGSVIRPAAFCGVYGIKPSHGLIPRSGVLKLSGALDHVGTFARSVEDLALITECLVGADAGDPDSAAMGRPPLTTTAASEPPTPPRLAFAPSPVWNEAEEETREAFGEMVESLGRRITRLDLPDFFDGAVDWHRTVMETDLAVNLAQEYERGRDRLSPRLREMIERGQRHLAFDYNRAIAAAGDLSRSFESIFSAYDAIVTPAAPGPAPVGLESTGSPIFCTLWTLCGLPCITLPLLHSSSGMPMGVQLVGGRHDDARLLRTARWLADLKRD